MNKQTVTAITIIYNEEKLLDRCLSSVAGVVDEIMVFHDGPCSDSSLEIAKKYTDKIFVLEHKGHIEAHMANALTKVKTDWVIILDADEYISDDVGKLISSLEEDVDAYSFLEYIYDPKTDKYLDNIPLRRKNILHRISKMQYVGLMHAGYNTTGRVKFVDLVIDHKPKKYNYDFTSLKNKWVKFAFRDASGYFLKWKDIGKFNYDGPDVRLTLKKRIRFNFPLISMVLAVPLNMFRLLKKGFFNPKALEFGLFHAFYEAMVCYFIFKIRRKGSL
jgi:glycosyltransferase involved in cell wall biosynthesis